MKLQIEVDAKLAENEVILRCASVDEEVLRMQKVILEQMSKAARLPVRKEATEYYLPVSEILFLETEGNHVVVHTADARYESDYRLYELEALLSSAFIRISKSAIVNTDAVYAVTRNLTGASAVEFRGTNKRTYVSRLYYKPLHDKLEEKRTSYMR